MLRMNESLCLAVITVKRCFIVVFFRSECIRRNGIQAEHGLWMRKGALVSEKLSDETGQKHAKSDNGGTMIPRVPLAWLADHARLPKQLPSMAQLRDQRVMRKIGDARLNWDGARNLHQMT